MHSYKEISILLLSVIFVSSGYAQQPYPSKLEFYKDLSLMLLPHSTYMQGFKVLAIIY